MTALLAIDNVTVRFGGVTAVDGVSLEVREGELLGFIGPNGAGKTTLLRVVVGIVAPREGSVRLDGRPLDRLPIHARIHAGLGLAQQIVTPFRSMTLARNVALAAASGRIRSPLRALASCSDAREMAQALDLLGRVGLGEVADALPGKMPLGHLKRLELARALALRPKLLLLDEPLAGLNQAEAQAMAETIRRINADGQTIVLIEHNLREVTRICPRLYVQDNGAKLADGPTAQVMADPAVRSAYLGSRHHAET